jgi:hypothetical protein
MQTVNGDANKNTDTSADANSTQMTLQITQLTTKNVKLQKDVDDLRQQLKVVIHLCAQPN